ncbi:MDR/zinc-dependent alcohol dehydrogenase-like family protein [Roseibium salinum]|uniref:Zinc-binding dehydrogenase n=1 Tax=Roseibium salinum TaxID=1604349 RepID=A0ABT3QWZ5_9HYPH|nr:zinc-binding dehydrogenase [Roseibium sp. DSM 29163]MCX2721442.1 zinc-binding dehydrogenase [Roseibium sp. DSM 29163]MDN3721916.1 zinc-binding dehydrogenase [Roseibium salinum]
MQHVQLEAVRNMKAARVTGPGKMRLDEVPLPGPGVGEVRIRLQGCGVCASNLGPWSGPEWMEFPTEAGSLGHEGWGIVDAVGAGVAGVDIGDRVAAVSFNAYAEYDVAPADAVVKLPASLENQPFPGEPLGCAINIFNRSNVRLGDTVAIVGTGFIGLLLTQLCSQAGARVIAISRRLFPLTLARQAGAAHTIPMHDHGQIIEHVREITGDRFCDVVIEATGYQWPLDLAAEITRVRGRLVIAGYHQDGARQVNMQLWNWRGLDVVNAHERDPAQYVSGISQAVEACEKGYLDPSPLVTHTFTLDKLGDALDATRDRPDGFLKAVIGFE